VQITRATNETSPGGKDMTGLVCTEAVFAEQVSRPHEKGATGERALAGAVLEDAIGCYLKYAGARSPKARREFRLASEWIFSSERRWPFSFENICDVLGVDPQSVRPALAAFARPMAARARRRPRRRRAHMIVSH
jgi:hypothetical protein